MKVAIGMAVLIVVSAACSAGSTSYTPPTGTVPTTAFPGLSMTSAGDAEVHACGELAVFKADSQHNAGASTLGLDVSTLYGDAQSARKLAPTDQTMKRLETAAQALAAVVEFNPGAAGGRDAASAVANLDQICSPRG